MKLSGTVSDRLAVGAKMFVTATVRGRAMRQLRVITASDSEQSLIAHFGLGDATKAQTVRIEWPSGIVQELRDVASKQILTVVEHQHYAGQPPSFTQVAPAENGAVRVTMAEPSSGARYVLEASANLVNWTKLAAWTSGGTTFQFTDTQRAFGVGLAASVGRKDRDDSGRRLDQPAARDAMSQVFADCVHQRLKVLLGREDFDDQERRNRAFVLIGFPV